LPSFRTLTVARRSILGSAPLAGIIKTVTIGPGGGTSEGAAVERKDVINLNILSLKIFNQVDMQISEQFPILPSAGNLTPVEVTSGGCGSSFKEGPD
jgi:hypothetical protein